jgi:hypothetical protein
MSSSAAPAAAAAPAASLADEGFTIEELKSILEKVNPQDENVKEKLAVVNRYINTSNESWADGKYYLGGQLRLSVKDKITEEHIAAVKNINEEKKKNYGGPVNSQEAASMARANRELQIIEDLITKDVFGGKEGGRKRRRKSRKKRRKSRKKRKSRKRRKLRKRKKSRKRRK